MNGSRAIMVACIVMLQGCADLHQKLIVTEEVSKYELKVAFHQKLAKLFLMISVLFASPKKSTKLRFRSP